MLIKSKEVPWKLITAGVVFTLLIFLPKKPLLSNDIYRYIWDGMLLDKKVNPYILVPEDQKLSEFHTTSIYSNLDWKGLLTPYPPFSQFVFWIGFKSYQKLGLSGAKLVFVLPIILFTLMLYKINSEYRKLSAILIINPLVISEIFYSGHIDSLSTLFTFICLFLYFKNRFYSSVFFLSLSFLSKIYPIIFLPFFILDLIKRGKKRIAIFSLLIFFLMGFIAWFPFTKDSILPLKHYLYLPDEQEYNASIFRYGYQILGSDSKETKSIAKNISIAFFLIINFFLLSRNLTINLLLASQITLFLSSTTLFPWYSLFLIPTVFMAVEKYKNKKLLIPLLASQLILTWIYFEPGRQDLRNLMLNLEYAVFAILIIYWIKLTTLSTKKSQLKHKN